MKRKIHPTMLVLLALGSTGIASALAQAPVDGDAALAEVAAEAPPVYVVEVLIFAYNEFNRFEEEFAPSKPHWPDALSDVHQRAAPETLQPGSAAWYLEDVLRPRAELEPDAAVPPITTAPVGPPLGIEPSLAAPPAADFERPQPWYRLLEPDELELGRAFARLNTLGAYTPLLHAGWSQPTLLENEAQPFELAWLGQLEPAGSIRLHRSRFLHLTLDVSLQDDYRYRQTSPPSDSRWPLAEFVGPVQYRIDVQRRVRSGELHFFDHPAFGVLVVVRPAPENPAETGTAAGPAA